MSAKQMFSALPHLLNTAAALFPPQISDVMLHVRLAEISSEYPVLHLRDSYRVNHMSEGRGTFLNMEQLGE